METSGQEEVGRWHKLDRGYNGYSSSSQAWPPPRLLTLTSEKEDKQMWAALLLVGMRAGWWEVQTQVTCYKSQHISQLQTDTCEVSGCEPFLSGKPVYTGLLQEKFPTNHISHTLLDAVNCASQRGVPRTFLKVYFTENQKARMPYFCLWLVLIKGMCL